MNLRNVNIYVTLLSITVSLFYSTVNPAIADDTNQPAVDRPNVLFIFSDDHAVNAISSYGATRQNSANAQHRSTSERRGFVPKLVLRQFDLRSITGLYFDRQTQPQKRLHAKRWQGI